MIACMGGWCTRRNNCPHHHAEDRRHPIERLCDPGADGVIEGRSVRIAWDRAEPDLPAGLLDVLH